MKGPGPRAIAPIGAIANVTAFGSLFLTYATEHFRDNPQLVLGQTTAWTLLFPIIDAGKVYVPFGYYLLSMPLLLAILFPLSLHLISLTRNISRAWMLWSYLAALVGVIWCLFMDYLALAVATHYGSTEFSTLGPGAGLLLLCLLASGACDIYWRRLSNKTPLADKASSPTPSL